MRWFPMNKLEVLENKKLVLKHVLMKQHKNIELDAIDEKLNSFTNQLQLFNVQTFGPLVTRNAGTTIHDDGSLTTDYELFVQAHDYKQYQKTFRIKDRIEFPNCIYLKFKGNPEELHFAHSKLDLYFYEQGLTPNGDVITVLINEYPEQIEVDLFRPVASL